MISRLSFLNDNGFSYVELLAGLLIAALVFAPAYRFASSVLKRQASETWRTDEAEMALAVLSRDLRCASAAARETPFHSHDGHLAFTAARPRGLQTVNYGVEPDGRGLELRRNKTVLCVDVAEWRLRFFDGEKWEDQWGWNVEAGRPSDGVRGLPLAVEIEMRAGDGVLRRRVVPVMAAVIDRWAS